MTTASLRAAAAVLVSFLIASSRASPSSATAKCCGKDFSVREAAAGSRLECVKKTSRLQVVAEQHDFLKTGVRKGECLDTDDHHRLVLYRVDGAAHQVVSRRNASFPKCCPLDFVYSPQRRSCLHAPDATTSALLQGHRLVTVGLPHCKVIVDTVYNASRNDLVQQATEGLEEGRFCLDRTAANGYVVRRCQEGLEACHTRRCLKKCCPDGQSYVGGSNCVDTFVHGMHPPSFKWASHIESPEADFELIYNSKCDVMQLVTDKKIQYSIDKKGVYKYYFNYTKTFVEENVTHPTSYCIEHASKGAHINDYHIFTCHRAQQNVEKFTYTLPAKILSVIFLCATVLVYCFLGEVKNTFGKILTNYCFAMTVLMVTLIVSHLWNRRIPEWQCKTRGYTLIFFNFANFSWVNIMSLDIWWTFGTPKRTIGRYQRQKDLKKFLFYFLYGWGLPFCLTMLIFILENTRILPDSIQPFVGVFLCHLEKRNYAPMLFTLAPIFIIQAVNTGLFISTLRYCIRVRNEINKLNDCAKSGYSADKERLGLAVKLSVIMGIVWILEVVTSFFDMKSYSAFTKILEVVIDNITCLQGVFIFLIFICKRKTLKNIRNKLGFGERRVSCSLSVTQSSYANNGHYPMNKRQTTLSMTDSRL